VADLKGAALRYLKPDNYVQVVLNPEKAAAPVQAPPPQATAGAQHAPR
jgi:predicted Zn-dependent peptidase